MIGGALRAVLPQRGARPVLEPATEDLIRRFAAEHDDLADVLDAVRDAAGLLAIEHGPRVLGAVREVDRLLTERLLPHEYAEEHELYPAPAGPLGGGEATATMSRAHSEIDRLARRIATHVKVADTAGQLRGGGQGRVRVLTRGPP
ncbi:hemerythrin domain-containing protein [Microbispora siamensis]